MKFGVSMPIRGALANAANIRTLAERAEALGYEYLTVSDHIVVPTEIDSSYPYSETGDFPWSEGGDVECMEQFTLLSWLAGITSKIPFTVGSLAIDISMDVLGFSECVCDGNVMPTVTGDNRLGAGPAMILLLTSFRARAEEEC